MLPSGTAFGRRKAHWMGEGSENLEKGSEIGRLGEEEPAK